MNGPGPDFMAAMGGFVGDAFASGKVIQLHIDNWPGWNGFGDVREVYE